MIESDPINIYYVHINGDVSGIFLEKNRREVLSPKQSDKWHERGPKFLSEILYRL